MRSALQANPNFSRHDNAKHFLDMLNLAANPAQALTTAAAMEESLKSNPNDVPALMAVAAINEQKSDFNAARQTYEKVLGIYPDFTPATKSLGIINYRQGDYAKSETMLKQSVSRQVADANVMYYLGMAQYQLKKQPESKRTLARALELGLPEKFTQQARTILAELK